MKKSDAQKLSETKNEKSNQKYKKIGMVIKFHQPKAATLALHLTEFILSRGSQVYFAEESDQVAKGICKSLKKDRKNVKTVSKIELVEFCDLIVVLGGDGTFLSIARLMKKRSVPILGINMGQLGFLTEIKRDEALQTMSDIMNGVPLRIQERPLLEVTLQRKNKIIYQGPVVNDVVISKGAIARIIGLQVWVNDLWVHHIRADGMIVSTTTGSTAYSLAAGGPIVDPRVPALVVTPICAHSLTLRSLILPDTSSVKVTLSDRPGSVLLTLDGQDVVEMEKNDTVIVQKFKKHSLKLISSASRDYFSLLREKLKFGARD